MSDLSMPPIIHCSTNIVTKKFCTLFLKRIELHSSSQVQCSEIWKHIGIFHVNNLLDSLVYFFWVRDNSLQPTRCDQFVVRHLVANNSLQRQLVERHLVARQLVAATTRCCDKWLRKRTAAIECPYFVLDYFDCLQLL